MNTVEAIRETLFVDLGILKREVQQYSDESEMWKVLPGTTNSAGVLFVHLTRSLRHFIGSSFANTHYLRQRDEEFLVRDVPLKDMLAEFEILQSELNTAFENIKIDDLDKDFPVKWRDDFYPAHFILIRMIAHVNYHLGQINYHRRFFASA